MDTRPDELTPPASRFGRPRNPVATLMVPTDEAARVLRLPILPTGKRGRQLVARCERVRPRMIEHRRGGCESRPARRVGSSSSSSTGGGSSGDPEPEPPPAQPAGLGGAEAPARVGAWASRDEQVKPPKQQPDAEARIAVVVR